MLRVRLRVRLRITDPPIILTCEAAEPGQVEPGDSRPASARLPPQFQRLISRPVTGASQQR